MYNTIDFWLVTFNRQVPRVFFGHWRPFLDALARRIRQDKPSTRLRFFLTHPKRNRKRTLYPKKETEAGVNRNLTIVPVKKLIRASPDRYPINFFLRWVSTHIHKTPTYWPTIGRVQTPDLGYHSHKEYQICQTGTLLHGNQVRLRYHVNEVTTVYDPEIYPLDSYVGCPPNGGAI